MSEPETVHVDQVLPPGAGPQSRGKAQAGKGLLSSVVAYWLDSWLKVPGTKFRVGLDPFLAMIPVVGDVASTTFGATILLEAIKHKAPFRLLVRMAGNMAVNSLLDAIPFLGPIVTAWFKSNARNHEMLARHVEGHAPMPRSRQSKLLVLFVLGIAGLAIAINIVWWTFVLKKLSEWFSG